MDPTLTAEQKQIQETVREFLEDNDGIELARRRMEGETDVVDELWDGLQELDLTTVTVPLEAGGLGEGMVYLSAILEEMGRYAMPGPYPETMAFTVPLLAQLDDAGNHTGVLEDIADGKVRTSAALYDDQNESLPGAIQLEARPTDGGYSLSGTKTLVPYGGEVDQIIVATRTEQRTGYSGISLFLVEPDVAEITQLQSLDRTRPMYEMSFDNVTVDADALVGQVNRGGDALERAIDQYAVATCAMLLGGADRAVDLSVEHGNEREQYGQPVGRFQAVKHRIADMHIDVHNARSLIYHAAWALDENVNEATGAVSMAKAFSAERLHRVFGDDIWNHGGMGFTWDHDTHIYLKQAKAWENFLGSPGEHFDRIADAYNS